MRYIGLVIRSREAVEPPSSTVPRRECGKRETPQTYGWTML